MLRLGGRSRQSLTSPYICTSCRLLARRSPAASLLAPQFASRPATYSDKPAASSAEPPTVSKPSSAPSGDQSKNKQNSDTEPRHGPSRRERRAEKKAAWVATQAVERATSQDQEASSITEQSTSTEKTKKPVRSLRDAFRTLVFGAPAPEVVPIPEIKSVGPKSRDKTFKDRTVFYDLKRLRQVMEQEMVKEKVVRGNSKEVPPNTPAFPGKESRTPKRPKKPVLPPGVALGVSLGEETRLPTLDSTDAKDSSARTRSEKVPVRKVLSKKSTVSPDLEKDTEENPADKRSKTPATSGEAAEAKPPAKKKKSKKKAKIPDIETVSANDLVLVPIDKPQPPVPSLAYGLDRVLFNPGVYHLQDPRSRVYNFDPYLAGIMPVKEFDFGALRQYVTSSKDRTLANIAKEAGKKYAGSTSSMTSMLAHFHYLLSAWRPINPDHVSRSFPVESTTFTRIGRAPAAIFLQYQDGTYAIDADKEFDTANVLSMLGKSMEKLLTLPKEDFEKFRRTNSDQLTEEERNADESYHYTTMGDFMMRSQLDAHDDRVPGTGMFDLKTRAVVSIRMDAQEYHKGVGYEIRHRFGEWESYEREYYDMIRSAFMKYSLQVRMGRMDGIFVAFHNIQRIFGFQYISLPEMDQTIHGTSDLTVGNNEFKLSLHLLNKLLDKATERYPKQSLRLHFETRPTEPPFMYVFAKPVTQEQIEEVQNKNKAAVEAFERDMMGLVRDEKEDTEEETPLVQEEDQLAEEDEETSLDVWEDMRLKVEEALENDEQGENFVRDAIEEALEASGLLKTESVERKQRYLKALMDAIVSEDEAEAPEAPSDVNVTRGEMSIGGEGEGASETVRETPVQAEPVEEALDEADRRMPDIQEAEQESAGQDLVEGEAESESVSREQDTAPEPDTPVEQETPSDQLPLKDLIMRLAAKSRAGSAMYKETKDGLEEDESSDWQKLRKFEEILHEIVAKTPKSTETSGAEEETSSSEASEQSTESAASTEAQQTTKRKRGKQADGSAGVDSITKGDDILGMIVTMRNKVDGKFVERPEKLTGESTWEVHYTIEELAKDRAANLYQQTITRRSRMLQRTEDTGRWNSGFKEKLETLSKGGRAWRRAEVETAKGKPVYVYGVDRPLKWEDVFSDEGEPHPPKLNEKQ